MPLSSPLPALPGRSRDRPLLLVLDDAHRLDRPTVGALVLAVRRLAASRTLVLAATRAAGHEDGLRAAGWGELTLTGLSRTAAAARLREAFAPPLDDLPSDTRLLVRLEAELTSAARDAERRGDLRSASRAAEHAARLAARPKLLERGLVQAAELALDGGEALRARVLLDEAERGPHGRVAARWVRERLDGAGPPAAAVVQTLAEAAEREAAAGAPDHALALLVRAAEGFELGQPGPAARAALLTALERVDADADDLRRLAVLALAGPEAAAPELRVRLGRALGRDPGGVPDALLAGIVADRCGDHALAHRCLTTAAAGFTAHGVARLRAQALARRTWASVGLDRWDEVTADAQEAGRLAERTDQPLWAARAHAAAALVAGSRGDGERSEALAGRAERLAIPLNATAVLADVVWARGRTALADGRHAEALQHLSRLLDPADPAHRRERVARALPDLADAAVGAGDRARAAALVDAWPDPTAATAVAARTILLAAQDVDAALGAARAIVPGTLTPFEWARLQLVLGAILRRARRGLESRGPLVAAEETFVALGAAPWAARARGELRASGQAPRRRGPESRDDLTPQELQIARLAATGLSNREIGQRLFLSPRTVGSHLYRVFPKLGVTSRVQLRDALLGDEAVAA
jgi:DNA-binding CsgD family transcriptional regulator/tetratricopeptide (TPR) repeat protein